MAGWIYGTVERRWGMYQIVAVLLVTVLVVALSLVGFFNPKEQ